MGHLQIKVEIPLDLAQLGFYRQLSVPQITYPYYPDYPNNLISRLYSLSDKQKICMQQFKKFKQISKHLLHFIRSLQSMYFWCQNEYRMATSDHFPIQYKQGWRSDSLIWHFKN